MVNRIGKSAGAKKANIELAMKHERMPGTYGNDGDSQEPVADVLSTLAAAIRTCRICRDHPLAAALPHDPRPVLRLSATARICVASQAPGTRVHASGVPFTDPSGDRLRAWMGVDPATFYDQTRIAIVPMGFCFPGQDEKGSDLPPRRECAPAWRGPVFGAMPRVNLVLAIGSYAQAWHLRGRAKATLTETVAAWREYHAETSKPLVLPLPHPSWRNSAWLRRNPWFEVEYLPVLRAEIARRLALR
jgi:uracil-DNA glycosylase